MDVDSAKKAFFEVVRIFAAEAKQKNKGLLSMNQEMLEVLNYLS